MTVYVMVQLRFTERAAYDRYQARFFGVFSRYRGTLLAADAHPQVLEGEWPHDKVVLMAFHDEAAFRKELFVERDIIETPAGLGRGIFYTFGGAAIDVPLDERNMLILVAGLQEFTGDNLRVHLRANYVRMLKPEWGLSAQLRTRWFRNSDPREADYFSPRWYAQVLPVLQLRRTTDGGWRYLLAGGVGLQRDSDSGWRRATYLNGQVTSPPISKGWAVTGNATFAETPTDGQGYRYFQVSLGVVRAF